MVIFCDGNFSYMVQGNIGTDELLKIAESIK